MEHPVTLDIRLIDGEYYMPTSDGGMAVVDPNEAGNAYDRIVATENERLTPLAPMGPRAASCRRRSTGA